ncbi:hypothetical protein D3C78_855510 [compost metagenome]
MAGEDSIHRRVRYPRHIGHRANDIRLDGFVDIQSQLYPFVGVEASGRGILTKGTAADVQESLRWRAIGLLGAHDLLGGRGRFRGALFVGHIALQMKIGNVCKQAFDLPYLRIGTKQCAVIMGKGQVSLDPCQAFWLVRQCDRQVFVFCEVFHDQLLQAQAVQQAAGHPRCEGAAGTRHYRQAHPQGVIGSRSAIEGEAVEEKIGRTVACQVLGWGHARGENQPFGGNPAFCTEGLQVGLHCGIVGKQP